MAKKRNNNRRRNRNRSRHNVPQASASNAAAAVVDAAEIAPREEEAAIQQEQPMEQPMEQPQQQQANILSNHSNALAAWAARISPLSIEHVEEQIEIAIRQFPHLAALRRMYRDEGVIPSQEQEEAFVRQMRARSDSFVELLLQMENLDPQVFSVLPTFRLVHEDRLVRLRRVTNQAVHATASTIVFIAYERTRLDVLQELADRASLAGQVAETTVVPAPTAFKHQEDEDKNRD